MTSAVPVARAPNLFTVNLFCSCSKISNSSKTEVFRSIFGHGSWGPFSGPVSFRDCVVTWSLYDEEFLFFLLRFSARNRSCKGEMGNQRKAEGRRGKGKGTGREVTK